MVIPAVFPSRTLVLQGELLTLKPNLRSEFLLEVVLAVLMPNDIRLVIRADDQGQQT